MQVPDNANMITPTGKYRSNWVQVLKNRQFPDWDIDVHGQAIVIKVSPEKDLKEIERQFPDTFSELSPEVKESKEWLKFIFYNGTNWFQYVVN